MKKITLKNYKTDKLYRRVAKAVHEILSGKNFVAPIEIGSPFIL